MNKQNFFRRSQAVLLAGALAVGIGVVGFAAGHNDAVNPPVVLKLANADEGPSRTGFAPIVKKVLPAVVSVESTKMSKIPTASRDGAPDDPLFRQFFGNGNSNRQFNSPGEAPNSARKGSVRASS